MDPVTIAGLVLGIIPLLISAAENYEVTFQPFVSYYRHAKEMKRFLARLEAQHTIFKNECQLLLFEVDQNLSDILGNPQHPARSDGQLSSRLEALLGGSYNTCVGILSLINGTLTEISEETAGFAEVLKGKGSKGKGTWSVFRQKIKMGFSKTRLNNIVDQLKQHNEDLGRLSGQIRQLKVLPTQTSDQDAPSQLLSELQMTQQAAMWLYDALSSGWSCDARVEHLAAMSLSFDERSPYSKARIRFNLALHCKEAMTLAAPSCVSIESAPSIASRENVSTDPTANLQSALHSMGAISRKVKFEMVSNPKMAMAPSFQTPEIIPGPQLNLCTIGRLCRYFRRSQMQSADGSCVGFLEKADTFKHFIYPLQDRTAFPHTSQTVTLKTLLKSDSIFADDQDWIEKLRLGKLLAMSVLRFHSTPWLPESWSSHDICFMPSTPESHATVALERPFINIPLIQGAAKLPLNPADFDGSSLATNRLLFNLGVVLIELGFNTTFESLIAEESIPGIVRDRGADFLAARRLAELVYRPMNRTYRRVAEKCLNCNFGVATNLENAELQKAVLIHVVKELDVCLEQFRAFNSLAPPLLIRAM